MLGTSRAVRINLFGRPHLSSDGAPLKFKAPLRALSLLGYLLLHGKTPLTRDAVAFALWPDDPEAHARANLRRHLFYLINDVLPPASPGAPWIVADKRTIAWNAASTAWCDLREYQRLAADNASAAEAASLYGGDFLEGLDDEWLMAPREALREQQVQVLLSLIASTRANGDFAAAIAYARQLLGVDPWREDAIRALIALRHATGDRAGALSTYRDFVKRLQAEMGVEPMPQTTAEYQRVAVALDPRGGSTRLEEHVPPSDEPVETPTVENPIWRAPESIANAEAMRSTPSFTGREAELAAIDAALTKGTGRAAVHGLGGVGKSSLAREYARRNRDRYAAVWWLSAESEVGIVDGLVRLGSTFVPAIARLEDRGAAAEQVIANVLPGLPKPALLIFDNLSDEGLLRRWCPHAVTHALVTSRDAIWSGDIAPIHLGTWLADETIGYLRREVGRSDISDADAMLVAEALGYLPLALAHAAAYLKRTVNVGARRYLERLGDHLTRAPKGADYPRAVFATFEEAIGRAEEEAPGAAAVLCLAAFFAPDAIPEELFRQRPGVYRPLSPARVGSAKCVDLRGAVTNVVGLEDALGALHRFSLLELSPDTRTYAVHRLVANAARLMLAGDETAWAASAVAAVEAAYPEIQFERWLTCERFLPHARAALDLLPAGVCVPAATRLANRCGRYLRKRASFAEAEALLRRGLATAEACLRSGPYVEIADNLEALASLLRDTIRLAEAEPLHRRALAILEATYGPDHPSVADALNDLAVLLHYSNRLGEAQALFRRALAIDDMGERGRHAIVALRLGNLAVALHEINVVDEAETLFRRALAIDEASHGPGHPDIATDLTNLGWLLLETNRSREAEPLLLRAVAIASASSGERHPSFAHVASDLAVLFYENGRAEEAEELDRRALDIFEATYGANHPVVAACWNNLAEVLGDRGRFEEAEILYWRALASDETNFGPKHTTVARDLSNLSGLLLKMGRAGEAEPLMKRSLAIVTASYAADHPRVRIVNDNLESLRRTEATPQRWRAMRRSPSRGLR